MIAFCSKIRILLVTTKIWHHLFFTIYIIIGNSQSQGTKYSTRNTHQVGIGAKVPYEYSRVFAYTTN